MDQDLQSKDLFSGQDRQQKLSQVEIAADFKLTRYGARPMRSP